MRSQEQFLNEITYEKGGSDKVQITRGTPAQRKRRKQRSDAEVKAAEIRAKRDAAKPSLDDVKIKSYEQDIKDKKQKRAARVAAERRKEAEAERLKRKSEDETAQKRISAATSRAKKIAGDKPKLERITSKDKSVTATGKAAMNTAKTVVSLGRKVASIPDRLKARKAKSDYGETQMSRGEAPTGGTKRQRIGYATKASRQRINTAVSNTRKKIGRGIEGIGKRIIPEDFIHEAEKGKKEVKKEKI